MEHFSAVKRVVLQRKDKRTFGNPDEIISAYKNAAYGIVILPDVIVVVFLSLKSIQFIQQAFTLFVFGR